MSAPKAESVRDTVCPRCGSDKWRNIGGEKGWWECADCSHYRWAVPNDGSEADG